MTGCLLACSGVAQDAVRPVRLETENDGLCSRYLHNDHMLWAAVSRSSPQTAAPVNVSPVCRHVAQRTDKDRCCHAFRG